MVDGLNYIRGLNYIQGRQPARRDLIAHKPEGEFSKMAPFRVLSVDIECAGRKGCFPEAEKDAVIQIATVVQEVGAPKPFLNCVLTLNTCAPIAGAQVRPHPAVCMSRAHAHLVLVHIMCAHLALVHALGSCMTQKWRREYSIASQGWSKHVITLRQICLRDARHVLHLLHS